MRFVVIGDIHGCHAEALQMIHELEITSEDEVISVGDIIHKGPNEVSCIELMESVSSRYVLGNHEEKQLRWERHEIKRLDFGKKNPMRHVEDYTSLSFHNQDWLKDKARLFIQLEAGDKKFLLVHGGGYGEGGGRWQ